MAKKPKQPKQTYYTIANEPGVRFVIERGAAPAIPAPELAAQFLKEYFRAIGRRGGAIGGLSTSEAKKEASRRNGAKGGRPKKQLRKNSGKKGT
jgi:hypothetical protein